VLGREYPDPAPREIVQANRIILLATFLLLVAVAVVWYL